MPTRMGGIRLGAQGPQAPKIPALFMSYFGPDSKILALRNRKDMGNSSIAEDRATRATWGNESRNCVLWDRRRGWGGAGPGLKT